MENVLEVGSLHVGAFRLLSTLLIAVTLLGAGPSLDRADVAVLRELRPQQRADVFVVARDGSLHIVYGDGVTLPAEPLPAPASVAMIPLPRPTFTAHYASLHARPAPALARAPQAIALARAPQRAPGHVPALAHALVALPQPVLAHRSAMPLMLAFEAHAFVPTIALPKPVAKAGRASQHDLAWLYAHRFDQSDDVPGVPVRSQVGSPFDTDSGAFHGVRANNGYSAVRVAVSIPCGVSHFVTGPGINEVTGQPGTVDLETGYVYIGGWGAGPRGVSVDAGLQKSSAQSEHDDYAFYWKFDRNKPITADERFPCGGPDVVLELYAVSPTQLVFSATGVTDSGERRTLTVVQTTLPDDGWTPDGGGPGDGIIIKRILSIAQPWEWHSKSGIGRKGRFSSGSYFGITGPHDLTPRIVWSRCEVGRVHPPSIVPDYHPWTPNDTWLSRVPGIYTDWPPLGVMRSTAGACDAAGLYLRA